MKYYAMTDEGVKSARTRNRLNKQLDGLLDENELYTLGPDKIVKLTAKDLEFIQDKRRMSRIPISNLYKKSNMVTNIVYLIIILLQIIAIAEG